MPDMDIDVAALDRLLTAPEQSDDLILDTRDRGVAARWHPEGPGARYLNVPYDEFEGDQDAAVAQLPQNAGNVHVLCARGISALDIAEILRERGIHAGIVGGGMAAWARYHRIVRVSAPHEAFAIYQIVRPAKGCLSYLVVSGKQALAIDCTRFTDVYRELCERLGATLIGVADTHLHADHVSGSSKLSSGAAPYYLSDEDRCPAANYRTAERLALDYPRLANKFNRLLRAHDPAEALELLTDKELERFARCVECE